MIDLRGDGTVLLADHNMRTADRAVVGALLPVPPGGDPKSLGYLYYDSYYKMWLIPRELVKQATDYVKREPWCRPFGGTHNGVVIGNWRPRNPDRVWHHNASIIAHDANQLRALVGWCKEEGV